MRLKFEQQRSLKRLQDQVEKLDKFHPSYPETLDNLTTAHRERVKLENALVKAITFGPVEKAVFDLLNEDGDMTNLLDDYLRDAISRFVVNEL